MAFSFVLPYGLVESFDICLLTTVNLDGHTESTDLIIIKEIL